MLPALVEHIHLVVDCIVSDCSGSGSSSGSIMIVMVVMVVIVMVEVVVRW